MVPPSEILRGQTLSALAQALATGRVSSVELVEQALAAIDAPDGEGRRAFVFVDRDGARAAAQDADVQRRKERRGGWPLRGIPISIKDLFDVAGQVTRAGDVEQILDGDGNAAQRQATPSPLAASNVRILRCSTGAVAVHEEEGATALAARRIDCRQRLFHEFRAGHAPGRQRLRQRRERSPAQSAARRRHDQTSTNAQACADTRNCGSTNR